MMHRALVAFVAVFLAIASVVSTAGAQEEYREPDPALTALVDAAMQPASAVSPDKRWVAAFEWKWVVALEEIAAEELKLAGLRIAPASFGAKRVLFQERSYNDAYTDPGTPVRRLGEFGTRVIHTIDGDAILLTGNGASPQGNIPFLDRHDFGTGQTSRLWHSEAPYYERVSDVLDAAGKRLLTLREARDTQPNFFVRDLDAESLTQVSEFPAPAPAVDRHREGVDRVQARRRRGPERHTVSAARYPGAPLAAAHALGTAAVAGDVSGRFRRLTS